MGSRISSSSQFVLSSHAQGDFESIPEGLSVRTTHSGGVVCVCGLSVVDACGGSVGSG